MYVYLGRTLPYNTEPRNLFALRWDLRLGQFDEAQFVIVPKFGALVVHFLRPSDENAQCYHNVEFDHQNNLSHELIYARFAWVSMKIVRDLSLDPNMFNLLTGPEETISGQHGGDRVWKRKRRGRWRRRQIPMRFQTKT